MLASQAHPAYSPSSMSQPVQSTVPIDRRIGNSRGLTQAYLLRDALATQALALLAVQPPEDVKVRCSIAVAATSLVKGWEAACDRIRIARGRPLPGSLRPSAKPQRSQSRQSSLAPQQPPKSNQSPEPPQPADLD